jgi:hypothetical protein
MVGPGVSELAACLPVVFALLDALGMLAALAVIWAAQPSGTYTGGDGSEKVAPSGRSA